MYTHSFWHPLCMLPPFGTLCAHTLLASGNSCKEAGLLIFNLPLKHDGEISPCLEMGEVWGQERHLAVENVPQPIPSDQCMHEKVDIKTTMTKKVNFVLNWQ